MDALLKLGDRGLALAKKLEWLALLVARLTVGELTVEDHDTPQSPAAGSHS